MDARGGDWCEENMGTIVGWLREKAERRKLPFIAAVGKLLVLTHSFAARKVEKKATDAAAPPALES